MGWNMVVNMGKTKRVRMVCVRPDQLVMSIVVVYSSSFLRAWYYFNLFYSMQCNILWRDLYLSSHPIENETNIFFFNVLQRCSSIERRMGVNSFSKKKKKNYCYYYYSALTSQFIIAAAGPLWFMHLYDCWQLAVQR